MYINSIERGQDATGTYSLINGLKRTLTKGYEVAVDPTLALEPDNTLIGHVRAKTIGVSKIENTHPFKRGKYILVHNGTLTNHKALINKYNLPANTYEVDSDVIAGCISKSDNFSVLSDLCGAAALVFHNTEDPNTIYVYRKGSSLESEQRPLFRGRNPEGMYISSVSESLYLIGCQNIKPFKEDILYTIENGVIISEKQIESTPYYETFSIYNYPDLQNSNNMYKVIGCWLRAKTTTRFKYYNTKPFDVKKGEYYLVTSVIDKNNVTINIDGHSDGWVRVPIALLEQSDIIVNGDYVMAVEDVYSRYSTHLFAVMKDEIVNVVNSYMDGDVSVATPLNKTTTLMNEKLYFRKLSATELKEFIASMPNITIPVNERQLSSQETINMQMAAAEAAYLDTMAFSCSMDDVAPPIIIGDDSECPFDMSEDFIDDDDEDDYYDYQANEADLKDQLYKLDELSEELNILYNTDPMGEGLGNKIVELMDYTQKLSSWLFPEEEEVEEVCQN